jgi:hypothetical protein
MTIDQCERSNVGIIRLSELKMALVIKQIALRYRAPTDKDPVQEKHGLCESFYD